MPKSVLTLDEINLLKRSETLKNQKIYGNIYEVLNNVTFNKAVSLEQLCDLDKAGIEAVTYNKYNLLDRQGN